VNDTLVLPHRSRIDRTDRWMAALAVLVFVLAVAIFLPVLGSPATIDHVTLQNSGAWPVSVAISSTDSLDWLPLGPAVSGSTTVPDVIDPGAMWVVRFSNGDVVYTERVDRSTLAAAHWHLSVPSQVENAIRLAGIDAQPTN
jgi:hypothetical protein